MEQYFNFSELKRISILVKQSVKKLRLDLRSKIVFTELATNYYMLTPIIAAYAGARKVYAFTGNIPGSSNRGNLLAAFSKLCNFFGVKQNIEIINKKEKKYVSWADIITNLGSVRPIDADFIDKLKPGAAIPLMWPTWEFRESDLDLKRAWAQQIPVMGTNEEDERIRITDYIGLLIIKKILDSGLEILNSKICVFGRGIFADAVKKSLLANGALVATAASPENFLLLKDVDAAVLARHSSENKIVLSKKLLKKIKKNNPAIKIFQLSGGLIDFEESTKLGIDCFPGRSVIAGYMGWTLSELGPKPLIDLHTAGLKVGEVMSDNYSKYREMTKAVSESIKKENLCQDFSPAQKKKYGFPKKD